jgi:lysophospholipase
LAETVIRPDAGRPLVILGEGVGALVAARAVETGARPAGLILSGATCDRPVVGDLLRDLGFGGLRAPGAERWRRAGPDDLGARRTRDAWRGAVTHAWQVANPDLRMGGPSLDWQAAFAELRDRTLGDLGRLDAPTVILDGDRPTPCLRLPGAQRRRFAGARPALELEDDAHRGPWLAAVEAALARMTRAARPSQGADHGP